MNNYNHLERTMFIIAVFMAVTLVWVVVEQMIHGDYDLSVVEWCICAYTSWRIVGFAEKRGYCNE